MALWGKTPICTECLSTSSEVWEKTNVEDEIICSICFSKRQQALPKQQTNMLIDSQSSESSLCGKASTSAVTAMAPSSGQTGGKPSKDSDQSKSTRKSSRVKPARTKAQANVKNQATKGRSRRNIFKKNPIKAPSSSATVITSDYIFYKGSYWQVGDVVSVMDHDGGIFYAQLRGFLQHQYFDKSAVITWLVPTKKQKPDDDFDPQHFIRGPEDDIPRTMDSFEFVCHAPPQYFQFRNRWHPSESEKPDVGFIWTSMNKSENLQ